MTRLLRAARSLWGATTTALGWRSPTFPIVLSAADPPVFPDPSAERHTGMIAVGGDLSVARLLSAYRTGIFPWNSPDSPVLWWSPDPRAIFELERFHLSRRLARTIRSRRFTASFDQAFARVIRACQVREGGTWITDDMLLAYEALHGQGHAHSIEVWQDGELAGGVYGVTIGGLFAGESMFSRIRDASKVALAHLVEHLRRRRYTLFDIQYLNAHTASLGGVEIPRREYLRRLRSALPLDVHFI